MKPVYVATDYHEKQLQRALLQYNRPQNASLVREALIRLHREDLIGFGPECLVRPEQDRRQSPTPPKNTKKKPTQAKGEQGKRPTRSAPRPQKGRTTPTSRKTGKKTPSRGR
jgi:hypothetical protein